MVIKASLAHGLQTSVGNLWKEDDDLSDYTIVVDNTSFKCHRFILSACSGFFHRLFRSQMKECFDDVIYLNEISKVTLDTIFNSIYKGVDGLTEDNVLDVWSATEFLHIDYLIDECKNFISIKLSQHNWCKFLNHAMLYSEQKLIDQCLEFIVKNFEHVRNAEGISQLTFDMFHKVIQSDFLAAISEDSVLDTILKWVNYKPSLEHFPLLFHGTLDNKDDSKRQYRATSPDNLHLCDNKEDNDGQKSTNDCPEKASKNPENESESQKQENSDQTDVGNDEDSNLSECSKNVVENKSIIDMSMSVDSDTNCKKNDNGQGVCREEDRKQHFSQLLSACRYLIVKPSCLENLLNNHAELLVETETHKLVVEALIYTLCVDRRHDCWPEAAVYRTSSPKKHVMVFLSQDNKFMAYSLDRDTRHEFATAPVCISTRNSVHFIATVFDNVLYLHHGDTESQTCMFTKQKQWETINTLKAKPWNLLLTHGNYIYGLYTERNVSLYQYACICGENKNWSKVCTLKTTAGCIVRFRQYIVLFTDIDSIVTVYYYNPANNKVLQSPGVLDGTSEDMASFTHREDVYILQTNGTLWKLFSTDTTPVDIELVSKLWDYGCMLKGCVLYKKQLFIFFSEDEDEEGPPDLLVTSLPGICESIKMIEVDTKTRCLPMVLHKSWIM